MKLQKISGQKSRNNFVGILDETDFHKDILKLTDLYKMPEFQIMVILDIVWLPLVWIFIFFKSAWSHCVTSLPAVH